jgi:pentatricopeptide repeat protein
VNVVRYPDFKHKKTGDALWVVDNQNPPWVAAKLAAMAPGAVQLDKFSWNRRLARYVKAGQHEKAMELFHQMQLEGTNPDSFTFVLVLNSCASVRSLEEGKHAHERIIATGTQFTVFVGSSLVDIYAKCGSVDDAWRAFNEMPSRNVVTWNAMIFGHVKCG